VPERRGRHLTLEELAAAVLILYPRYLDPVTHLPCPVETLIQRVTEGTAHNRLSWISRIRELQGRLMRDRR
jgi:capsular polysaccharide export protein